MLLLGLRSATDYTAQAGYPGMESVAMIIQTVRTDKGPLSLVYIALGALTCPPGIDLPPHMYPHPELGCGCEFRFDDHRCGWPIC